MLEANAGMSVATDSKKPVATGIALEVTPSKGPGGRDKSYLQKDEENGLKSSNNKARD